MRVEKRDSDIAVVGIFDETCPIIKCDVNGCEMKFLVDTGSRITVLRESAFDIICKKGEREAQYMKEPIMKTFVGVTGDSIGITGAAYLYFAIGETYFPHMCYISSGKIAVPEDVSGILGYDILSTQGIDLLLTERSLKIGDSRIPILNSIPQSRVSQGMALQSPPSASGVAVRLVTEVRVPPLSQCVCVGVVPKGIGEGTLGVIEADESLTNGIRGANCLVNVQEGRKVPFHVANLSKEALILPKNKHIGTFHFAESVEVDPVRVCGDEERSQVQKNAQFDLSNLQPTEKERLESLLCEYSNVFATTDLDLGCCDIIKHRIETGSAAPIYQRAYRVPYALRDEMDRQVQGLLDKDIIEHSKSPWGSPALLVQKPDGSYRFVIDYRKLNSATRIDPYPLPNIEETLSQLGSAKYFSVIDLASGFWQIEMDARDSEKTAFNTPNGHYQWRRMPMGLANSPAVWQRTADVILAGLLGKQCFVYMDDIIIYSKDFDEHLRDIHAVLERLAAAGLKLKPKKCQFLQREVKYLGHVVSAKGVSPDPSKIASVRDFPRPTTVKQIREFLGLAGYYRRHISNFSGIAKPLTALTKKNANFQWTTEAEDAFCALKQKLTEAPVLRYPDFSRPFILATDASMYAAGAVLSQRFDDGEHPVAFASRQLSDVEQRYGATERECLAVVWAVRHFRCYIYGRQFELLTDCHALRWLMTVRDPSSRLARWNLLLQEYNFEIKHKSGRAHANADALSRADTIRVVREFVPVVDGVELKREQRKDATLIKLIGDIEAGARVRIGGNEYFLDSDGILCVRRAAGRGSARAGRAWERSIVPASLVGKIMRAFHDAPFSGHLGKRKTRKRIERHYFWRQIGKDVASYCRRCHSCAERKSPKHKMRAPLQLFDDVSRPFERTAMDIVGPLPITTAGNRYMLVFVDHLSRFAEVIPIPDQKADTVARQFVERVVLRHGVPRQLLTDQGANFLSKLMRDVCEALNISKIQTTPYHPQSNGAVERFNQTLTGLLSHYVARDQRDWDEWVPFAMFAYNTAVHDSCAESPFYLLYGRDPDLPSAIIESPQRVTYSCVEDYREELTRRMQISHEIAAKALREAAEKRKKLHDRRSRDAPHSVGDRVYLQIHQTAKGLTKKFGPKWKGPYRILQKTSPVTFKIKGIQGGDEHHVHANRLKTAESGDALGEEDDETSAVTGVPTAQSRTKGGKSPSAGSSGPHSHAPFGPDALQPYLAALVEEELVLAMQKKPTPLSEKETIVPVEATKANCASLIRPCPYPLRSRGGVPTL